MKVDNTPPQSDIALGPRKPDGAEIPGTNWYRTRPFFAFAATDKAGGSGVDRSISPSGIFYAVDGGPSGTYAPADFTLFDPNADLRLANGAHDICWFAVDVAGNKEAGGDPRNNDAAGNCQFAIKVDDVAPGDRQPDQPGGARRLERLLHLDAVGERHVDRRPLRGRARRAADRRGRLGVGRADAGRRGRAHGAHAVLRRRRQPVGRSSSGACSSTAATRARSSSRSRRRRTAAAGSGAR